METRVKQFWARIVRAFLDIIIIDLTRKQNMGTYGIVKHLQKKYDVLISPTTVFDTLQKLARNGLIEPAANGSSESKGKEYTATRDGVDFVNRLLAERCEINQLIKILVGNGA